MKLFDFLKYYLNNTIVNDDKPYLVVFNQNSYLLHYYKRDNIWYEYHDCFSNININEIDKNIYINLEDYNYKFKWCNEEELKQYRRERIQEDINFNLKNKDSNINFIKLEVEKDKNKVITETYNNYILCGAVSSDEDYYYLYIGKDMKPKYSSCVCGYQLETDVDKIHEMNLWLNENKKEIHNIITDSINNGFDVPFTEFTI